MEVRSLTTLGAALLIVTVSGCPALLNDNWTIVAADASGGQEEAPGAPRDATLDTSYEDQGLDTGYGDQALDTSYGDQGLDASYEDQGVRDTGPPNGCTPGLLVCDGGCVDPSAVSHCGNCSVSCRGNAALCAPDDGGSYLCTSSCPTTSPTNCSGTCSNTSSDPFNCSSCGTKCTVTVSHAHAICEDGGCSFACDAGYQSCGGGCVDFENDSSNCGGCGATFACPPGASCSGGVCTTPTSVDGGPEGGTGCPSGGCPTTSTATGFSCPYGHCNGATSECTDPSGCFCNNDSECKSNKCVKVTRENDLSCGSSCTGAGSRDGVNCELASPGIPSLGTSGGTYICPTNSGYKNSTLSCDSTHTNCYCTADSQCPSGKCIPSSNNNNCSGCTGTGTPDYRGCQATAVVGFCPIYIGCPANSVCQYPSCYCTTDAACASGHCISSSHNNNCSSGLCTGTGADDGHGCMPAPSSVPCMGVGGTMCATTLTPAPVINAAKTACLCVDDSNCSSGKCVNKDSQCTGSCTGSGTADAEDCVTTGSVANAWSCSDGNCNNVSSPTGQCTAAGVPCWCTSDSQCSSGMHCAAWSGCASGACTGSAGTSDAFHCVP